MNTRNGHITTLGQLAVIHAACLILFLSWRFGGMEPFARTLAGWACLPAPLLTVFALRNASTKQRRAAWWILGPLTLLATEIILSLFNLNRQAVQFYDTPILRAIEHTDWAPTTALPSTTVSDFALNAGMWLCGLNLMFTHPPRKWLRGLLWLIAINGMLLAGLGTVYRLTNATQILGHTPSPNPHFFATFIYHNHWGAFAILCAGAALSLALYSERHDKTRSLIDSAVPLLGLMGVITLITIPLSTARASTVAAGVLALGAGVLLGQGLKQRLGRNHSGDTARRIVLVAVIAVVIGFGAQLSHQAWTHEISQTKEQINDIETGGSGDARFIIYGDTLKLIHAKPWFGWGWQSFQYVYPDVQSTLPRMHDRIGNYAVLNAHNDWLQVLAEIGLFGTLCLLASLIGCLRWGGPIQGWRSSPQNVLLLALFALALLALVDFPLACPAVVITAAAILGIGAELSRGLLTSLPANQSEENTAHG